jgi:N-acetylglucosamine-6-phosphate deacetylase
MSAPELHAVTAATVFNGVSANRDFAVLIEADRIKWIGPRRELPTNITIRELPGDIWLVPGFIDIQVNGGGDVLFNDDPTPAGIARIAAAHRRFGTTSLLPTLISDTAQKMHAALEAVNSMPHRSGVLGVHFEGPFLSPEKPGAHDPQHIRRPTAADLELLLSTTNTRLVTLAPEEVSQEFIACLTKAGVRVALGHSMATYMQTKQAFAAGLTGFTHLFNAMPPLTSREPGPIAAALENAEASFGMIVDGVHVAPATLRLALHGAAHPMLVTDAMPPVGGKVSHFMLGDERVQVQGEACRRGDGILAGTALDMASAVRNCVRMLDVPLATALRYASAEPARFLGIDDRIGHLHAGMYADMVALDPNAIKVQGTWLAGKWEKAEAPQLQPACAFAFAARALPESFLRRRRTAAVLPWMRVTLLRGMARRAFFFCFSMLRSDRTAMTISLGLVRVPAV